MWIVRLDGACHDECDDAGDFEKTSAIFRTRKAQGFNLVNFCIFVGVRCQDRRRVVDHFQGHGLIRSTSWGIFTG